jgi:hypothetical protein
MKLDVYFSWPNNLGLELKLRCLGTYVPKQLGHWFSCSPKQGAGRWTKSEQFALKCSVIECNPPENGSISKNFYRKNRSEVFQVLPTTFRFGTTSLITYLFGHTCSHSSQLQYKPKVVLLRENWVILRPEKPVSEAQLNQVRSILTCSNTRFDRLIV